MPSPQPFPLVEERSDALTPTLSHGEREKNELNSRLCN